MALVSLVKFPNNSQSLSYWDPDSMCRQQLSFILEHVPGTESVERVEGVSGSGRQTGWGHHYMENVFGMGFLEDSGLRC